MHSTAHLRPYLAWNLAQLQAKIEVGAAKPQGPLGHKSVVYQTLIPPARTLLLTLAAAAICASQPLPPQQEPTVVTVTGRATPVSATAAAITVLPRQVIEDSYATDLTELLRQAPFVSLAQSGGHGGLTTATIRGGKPNFTMVLLDGIPVNDITNVLGGSYDFSGLSTDNIEQVEIVRGPLSAMYGSDAISGVINVISRHAEGKNTLLFRAGLGNFSTWETQAGVSGKIRRFDYSFSGSYQDVGVQVENDPFRLGTLAFNARLALGSNKLLHFVARYANSRTAGFPINGGGPEYSINRQPQSQQAGEAVAGAGWRHQVNPRWLYTADFGLFRRAADSAIPAILDAPVPTFRSVPAARTSTIFYRVHAGFSNTVQLWRHLSGNFSGGWRGETGRSTGVLGTFPDAFTTSRNTPNANMELAYQTDRLTATAAVRLDRPLAFRSVYSPRAGVSYRVREGGPRLRWSWGRGFKLPSFYAVADPIVGNRLLRPEFSTSVDVGVEQDMLHGRVRTSLTAFRSTYRDLVDFSAQLFRLVNRQQASTRGVEFAASIPVNTHLEFSARASYLDWHLQVTNEPLRDQPHWQSGAAVSWRAGRRWHSRMDTLWVGRRYNFSVPRPDQLTVGGYSTTNAVTSFDWSSKVTTYLRADNLFNACFHESIGFPNPGRWIRGGIALRL